MQQHAAARPTQVFDPTRCKHSEKECIYSSQSLHDYEALMFSHYTTPSASGQFSYMRKFYSDNMWKY